jgi:hypothetical protein
MPVTGTQVVPPASPTTRQLPVETSRATATIRNGTLEPATFAGQIGRAFELAITGDGREHTLAIDELVADKRIAASGETTISFTVEGEPRELEIRLDGTPVGTFDRQAASGATEL